MDSFTERALNQSRLAHWGNGRDRKGMEGSATARRLWFACGSQIQTVRSVTREATTLGFGR